MGDEKAEGFGGNDNARREKNELGAAAAGNTHTTDGKMAEADEAAMTANESVSKNGDDSPGSSDGAPASAPAPVPAASPPNGGLQAWLQVLGSFCLYFNTWGLTASFGTFQAIYETDRLADRSSFQVSVIGSLQIFLMVSLGAAAGPLYDAGYFRHLLGAGTLLIVAGSLAQSFCAAYWQFVLVQGAVVGAGCGCLCLLGTALPSLWFTTRLPLANGLAATGSGLGGVILPIMVREVNARAGLGWAARSLAFTSLLLLGLANLVLRQPPWSAPKRKARAIVDATALRDAPFLLFVLGCFAVDLGIFTPFVHVQAYALRHAAAGPRLSLYLLAIANAGGVLGRVLPVLLARRLGAMNLMVATAAGLAATAFGLLSAGALPRLLAAVVVFGFLMGTLFALMPTVFVALTPDPKLIGTRFGMAFAAMSVGMLFGPPVAGVFVDRWGYHAAWVWSGSTIAAGGCLIVVARMAKSRQLGGSQII